MRPQWTRVCVFCSDQILTSHSSIKGSEEVEDWLQYGDKMEREMEVKSL